VTPLEFAGLVLAVPVIATVVLMMLRYPVGLLAVYGAIVPFGSSLVLPVPFLPSPLRTATSLLGGIVIVRCGWEFLQSRVRTRHVPAPAALWCLYGAVAVASLAWSVVPSTTSGGLIVLFGLLALYLVVSVYPFEASDLRVFERGVVAGAFLTSCYGLLMAAIGALPRSAAGVPRFEITGGGGGEGGDPNITAAALLLGFAIAVFRIAAPGESRLERWSHAAAAAFIAAGITLTASRGGLVGIGIVLLIILWRRGHWRVTVAVVGAVAIVMMLFPEALLLRLGDTDTTGRTGIWRSAAVACPEYCLVGAGYDAFPDVHRAVYLSDPGALANRPRFEAHSIWIESLLELGILGLAILVMVLGVTTTRLVALPRPARRGALAALVALLFTNTFLSNLAFKYFWLVLMYCAVVESTARATRQEDADRPIADEVRSVR